MAIALSNCDAEDSTAWPPATPLLTAIAHGHTDVARLLLAARADPNAAAPTGADAAEPEDDLGGVSAFAGPRNSIVLSKRLLSENPQSED